MKFKFQSTCDETGAIVIHEFESSQWYSALDNFVKFLRGSGYQLKDNSVGINEAAGHMFLNGFMISNITMFDQVKE